MVSLQVCICRQIKLFFPVTDAVGVLCLTGRDSAETTEQRGRGGTKMEPESFKLRAELTASESSVFVNFPQQSDLDLSM